ncbi:potassium channel family protein [Sagittula salina]|uniref:Two pore domain potassium channel family protein n=1 Tax=Sagittula salina TaxID=2820268 RepID=A0A940MUH1_9RHOB|nr:potassium channel family protein [Sagittula salina]MBP0483164.1 two pore domain potassium channel family protein [Sagittula salina]
MRNRVRELYVGESPAARRFRYAVLAFDLLTIAFVVATSFTEHGQFVEAIDVVFGLAILAEFGLRVWISANRMRLFTRLTTLADVVAIVSFLAPLAGEGLGFLRVLRTLRLLHTYHLGLQLKRDFPYFRKHDDVVLAVTNLGVFIFVMTGLVYATQYRVNEQIANYADALYFTVTALTTTGFGDIVLKGSLGRLISVVVMLCGITLFLRLVQVLFRPNKVRCECKECGLVLHDADAVHCKHCGAVMNIKTEGVT